MIKFELKKTTARSFAVISPFGRDGGAAMIKFELKKAAARSLTAISPFGGDGGRDDKI